jgi:hypothetical protein
VEHRSTCTCDQSLEQKRFSRHDRQHMAEVARRRCGHQLAEELGSNVQIDLRRDLRLGLHDVSLHPSNL